MGGLLTCFGNEEQQEELNRSIEEKKVKKDNEVMGENDKAKLKLDKSVRQVKGLIKSCETTQENLFAEAKKAKIAGDNAKAVRLVKRKKLYQKSIDTANGQLMMLEETQSRLRSAKIDVNVMEAMKTAQDLIDDLREKANVENFEALVERNQEAMEQQDEIDQLLQEAGIGDEEVDAELEALEAEIAQEELGDQEVPINKIDVGADEEPGEKVEIKEKKQVIVT